MNKYRLTGKILSKKWQWSNNLHRTVCSAIFMNTLPSGVQISEFAFTIWIIMSLSRRIFRSLKLTFWNQPIDLNKIKPVVPFSANCVIKIFWTSVSLCNWNNTNCYRNCVEGLLVPIWLKFLSFYRGAGRVAVMLLSCGRGSLKTEQSDLQHRF